MNNLRILGLDVGTSSVRGIVYDEGAIPVPGLGTQMVYSAYAAPDGTVTVSPDVLLELVFSVLDKVCRACRDANVNIDAVGFSCFWHSLMVVDGNGDPITPVVLWADTRPAPDAMILRKKVDISRLRRHTGATIHASYWPAKVMWLDRVAPEVLDRPSVRLVSFAEYLYARIFGRFAVSTSMASGTGLLNIANCRWDTYALSVLPRGIEQMLSPLNDGAFCQLPRLSRERWGGLRDVPWYPAWGDGACSNVGVGGVKREQFVITVGTSSAIRVVVPQNCVRGRRTIQGRSMPISLWNYRLDEHHGVIGGALSEGGNLVNWLTRNFQLPDLQVAEAEIARRLPDAANLTVLPYIAGERSPGWVGNARTTINGIGLQTTAIDVLQAAMESVAYELRTVFDDLCDYVGAPIELVAAGSALTRSPVWIQMLCNILEREISVSDLTESSCRGAAVLALDRMGVRAIEEVDGVADRTFTPRSDSRYQSARSRQMLLYRQVIRTES